jgi:hypothetical protein
MHGLGLSLISRGLLLGAFIASALFVYNQRGWFQLNEILRIPIIEYLAVFLLAGIIAGGLGIARRFKGSDKIYDHDESYQSSTAAQ